ncbi:MAG: TIGR04211 family SH3 domain-containing protein [Proteobacteria bacterium]|nr:TIGR04211 family SH3 domain-containing protein [Pseudomonadota bacterium]
MHKYKIITIGIFWLIATVTQAETVYVIDELKIGLHESASINSPIVKLVPSGTELTVIGRSDGLVHVEEPEGGRGWINSKYLVDKKPGKARVSELEKEIELLKSSTIMTNDETEAQKDLAQQLKSERLKSGQLQADLADLKAKIASVDNSGQLLSEIEQLKQENEQLKSQLESSGIALQNETTSTSSNSLSLQGWKQYSTAIIIILVIGMAIGAFIIDYLGRRRHGGFRI